MTLLTKINGLKVLLSGLVLLILFNLILSYMGYKSENISSFSRLSVRRVHKYNKIANSINSTSKLDLEKKPNVKIVTVISENASTTFGNTIIPEDFALSQAFKGVNASTFEKQTVNSKLFNSTLQECKYPEAEEGGPITPNTTLESLDLVESQLGPLLKPGGAFQPKDCLSKDHVAIIVPFRDRYAHLSVFIKNIHPFLMKQNISYRVFIIEQTNGQAFNRASLMNIGYLEALKLFPWDCFIFHDVDLLPLDSRNLYICPRQPRHMSVAINTLDFKLPYPSIFGGVSAMTSKQFQMVNGFSNSYFGWGGEDDDMSNRLEHAHLFIARYPVNIARYMMLKHQKQKANPKRYENLANSVGKMETDGINSIKYKIYSFKEFPTFTWYLADLSNIGQKS